MRPPSARRDGSVTSPIGAAGGMWWDRGVSVCPRCERPAEVGVLCAGCAQAIAPAAELLSDHVSSIAGLAAAAWLIDGYGTPHPVSAQRQRIGRSQGSELVILHGSVSRAHAELSNGGDGWLVRDLGSRNATRVDDHRVVGRVALADGAILHVGEVALLFIDRPGALVGSSAQAPATTRSASAGGFRAVLRGAALELCALGTDDPEVGGALLHRPTGGATWTELSLPPLEYHLLRTLCTAALAAKDSPQRSRGAVVTRSLAKVLPFQTRYPNDENVRQVVRRLRTTLDEIGAAGVIETVPGRGYFVAWPVSLS